MSKTDHARKHKTPRQRAEEAHGVAQRRVEKLTKDREKLVRDLAAADTHLEAAQRRLDYVSANPDLAQHEDDPAQTTIDDALGDETPPESGEES